PNYHLLETIAKYDNPEIRGVTGLRNYEKQKSSFCNKVTALEDLSKIVIVKVSCMETIPLSDINARFVFENSPGAPSNVSSPIVKSILPETRYPVCSWKWLCTGRMLPFFRMNSVIMVVSPYTSGFIIMPGRTSL
ncbi:MAG: hypothetical protein MIO92_02000, partial [Methanosarcinaceae archaeon]|nr:hypothetical protein [Methanosarcinaceae archaeon]